MCKMSEINNLWMQCNKNNRSNYKMSRILKLEGVKCTKCQVSEINNWWVQCDKSNRSDYKMSRVSKLEGVKSCIYPKKICAI